MNAAGTSVNRHPNTTPPVGQFTKTIKCTAACGIHRSSAQFAPGSTVCKTCARRAPKPVQG